MDTKELQKHVQTLATLEENKSFIISCYLNLVNGRKGYEPHLQERTEFVKKGLLDKEKIELEDALTKISSFLSKDLHPDSKGAAIFVREGDKPFFRPLQFFVPLPTWFAVDYTPNIYHLVELKDTYHRYAVVVATSDEVRIFGVNCGEISERLWSERPELRSRIGREWTQEHYQNHRHGRETRFFKEKIEILTKLMDSVGYNHLILTGNPKIMARLRLELPRSLSDKLIDSVAVSGNDRLDKIVQATLPYFVEKERRESITAVESLKRNIYTDGLASIGSEACMTALENGQVDKLIIAQEFGDSVLREKIIKAATRADVAIEIVKDSFLLNKYGGVGCLLRYLRPEQHRI